MCKKPIQKIIYHAHHKSWWKTIHYVSWLRNYYAEAAVRRCFSKYLFLRLPKYSLENNCVGVFLNKFPGNSVKKRLQHRFFPVNIVKFLGTAFLQNTSGGCFCTLGTKVLGNIIRKNGKKHSHVKFSYNYLGSPVKQITFCEDHNIHKYSLFCLVVLAVENSRKPLLLVTYKNQVL